MEGKCSIFPSLLSFFHIFNSQDSPSHGESMSIIAMKMFVKFFGARILWLLAPFSQVLTNIWSHCFPVSINSFSGTIHGSLEVSSVSFFDLILSKVCSSENISVFVFRRLLFNKYFALRKMKLKYRSRLYAHSWRFTTFFYKKRERFKVKDGTDAE